MRLTEDEAKSIGLRKDKDGNWQQRETHIQRNVPGKVPQLESGAHDAAETQNAVQGENAAGRYRIVVTARCRRHTDPDNLCPKWFIDRLREFRVVPDDSSLFISEVVKRVVKVESWEPETTTIEVYED